MRQKLMKRYLTLSDQLIFKIISRKTKRLAWKKKVCFEHLDDNQCILRFFELRVSIEKKHMRCVLTYIDSHMVARLHGFLSKLKLVFLPKGASGNLLCSVVMHHLISYYVHFCQDTKYSTKYTGASFRHFFWYVLGHYFLVGFATTG